jgi:hypothetical protein
MSEPELRLIGLRVEDTLNIKVVDVRFDDNEPVIIIGGENEQGKSNLLKCIEMSLWGADATPEMPIRKGTEKSTVVADYGDIIIKIVTTKSGRRLEVTNGKGLVYKTPQALLDGFKGKMIDPVQFSTMGPERRMALLKSLVGLDFSGMDQERQNHYNDRTLVNRELKTLQAQLDKMPSYPEMPEEEVSVKDLMAEYERRNKVNSENTTQRQKLLDLDAGVESLQGDIKGIEEQITNLQAKIVKKREQLSGFEKSYSETKAKVDALQDLNCAEIKVQITDAERKSGLIRANKKREETAGSLDLKKAESEALTNVIQEIDDKKVKMLAEANFPVPGLGFNESDATFDGIPWGQLSEAQAIDISTEMGFALHPKIRMLLIRHGSLLDAKHQEVVRQRAIAHKGQIFMEIVSTDPEKCSLIIEDGMVKSTRKKKETAVEPAQEGATA